MAYAIHHILGNSIPTARDYVAGNLAVMFDGIENVGFGSHSSTAKTWVNLGYFGSTYNASRTSGSFQDDGAVVTVSSGAANVFTIPNSMMRNVMKGEWSYEIVFTPGSGWFSNSSSGIWGNHGAGKGVVGGQRDGSTYFSFTLYEPDVLLYHPSSSLFSADRLYTVSQAASNTARAASTWLNGILKASVSNVDVLLNFAADSTYIGSAYMPEPARIFDGVIHALRIYDRPLVAAEVQANYNIDKVRFGG